MTSPHNPNKHRRRSIRLKGWDYTTPGAYFITICTHQRENLFEEVRFRELAEYVWQNIPKHPHARHVDLDEWVVMPNHLHGILMVGEMDESTDSSDVGRGEATWKDGSFSIESSDQVASPLRSVGVEAGSVGAIVGNFKSLVARRVNNLRHTLGARVWQRGYYDRIIRNDRELTAIREYIWDNPRRWEEDRENLDGLLARMRWGWRIGVDLNLNVG